MSNSGKNKRHFLDERSNNRKRVKNINSSVFDWREAVHKAKGEEMEEFRDKGVTNENSRDKT